MIAGLCESPLTFQARVSVFGRSRPGAAESSGASTDQKCFGAFLIVKVQMGGSSGREFSQELFKGLFSSPVSGLYGFKKNG